MVFSQDTIFYNAENEKVNSIELATYYSVYVYDTIDTNLRTELNYYKSGVKKSEATQMREASTTSYKRDYWKVDGKYTEWYENGKPYKVIHYQHGKFDGKLILFWENGKTKRDDLFQEGDLLKGKCTDSIGNELEYFPYEVMPEFPGGEAALMKYLSKKIIYPFYSQMHGIQGLVVVKFWVEKDGAIKKMVIEKSVYPELDNEALRLIKRMPKWKPGMQEGKPVRVKYTLPVNFRLQ